MEPVGDKAETWIHALDDKHVRQVLKTPEEIVQWWQAKGLELGGQPHADVPRDSLASARCKMERTIGGVQLCFDELRVDTGLTELHLGETPSYFVQERGELLGDRIEAKMSQGELEEVLVCLRQFLDFMVRWWRQGYTEDTFNFFESYGYSLVDDRLIMLDVGGVTKGRDRVLSEVWKHGLFSHRSYWHLLGKHPLLASLFRAEVDKKVSPDLFRELSADK